MRVNRLTFSFVLLDNPQMARKIFPANLMASLVATLFSVARHHPQM